MRGDDMLKLAREAWEICNELYDCVMRHRDILSFGRLPPFKKIPVKRILENAITRGKQSADRDDIVVSSDCLDGLWTIGADFELISALGNIISNAIKYSCSGGAVAITYKLEGEEGKLTLCVRNEGDCIPSEVKEKALKGTYRSNRHLSMGLNIANYVIKQHGGSLALVNRSDCTGTDAIVKLSCLREEKTNKETPSD